MDKLIKHISHYLGLTEVSIDLYKYFEVRKIKKKTSLLEQGEVCKYYYFVNRGCLRMYFYRDNGSEQITQFALENWWITDYSGLMNQSPSDYCIQAVEDSEVLAISSLNYEKLLMEYPILERYFRQMYQRALAASQFRLKLIFEMSKEDMYLHFKGAFPDFIQRVPQYMLASFLGLTPEYLSELRKKNL